MPHPSTRHPLHSPVPPLTIVISQPRKELGTSIKWPCKWRAALYPVESEQGGRRHGYRGEEYLWSILSSCEVKLLLSGVDFNIK